MFSKVTLSLKVFQRNNIQFVNFSRKAMASSNNAIENLKSIFLGGVDAVHPKRLFRSENIHVNEQKQTIECEFNQNSFTIDISNNKRCHLVGFGKAVYGMANELSKVLGNRLKTGIISIPLNTKSTFPEIELPTMVRVFEGAKNNLPDTESEKAANEIISFVETLNKDDILFILISGGGSALLSLPVEGLPLNQKKTIIKEMANRGANITDINHVRIDLSRVKGGKLATHAENAGAVVSLIISDIIGDPIHLIASGPTVISNENDYKSSVDILEHYHLWEGLSDHIKDIIKSNTDARKQLRLPDNVRNVIIANNEIAVNHMLEIIQSQQQIGIVLSTQINGDIVDLSEAYFKLALVIQQFILKQIEEKIFLSHLASLSSKFNIRKEFLQNIVQAVHRVQNEEVDLYVIGAGEPTVTVKEPNGLGGRNQELALRFLAHVGDDHEHILDNVLFLSAGTDGIDG